MSNISYVCCEMMVIQLTRHCDEHSSLFDCPDAIIAYNTQFDEYGLIIHDGGTSVQSIHYCPWCGTALPISKRERWFTELAALGFDDPVTQHIPEAYNTDQWYRESTDSDAATMM